MGPRVYEPQALVRELLLLLGFSEVSALEVLEWVAALELWKLFGQECLDIHSNRGTCGESVRTRQGSAAYGIRGALACRGLFSGE